MPRSASPKKTAPRPRPPNNLPTLQPPQHISYICFSKPALHLTPSCIVRCCEDASRIPLCSTRQRSKGIDVTLCLLPSTGENACEPSAIAANSQPKESLAHFYTTIQARSHTYHSHLPYPSPSINILRAVLSRSLARYFARDCSSSRLFYRIWLRLAFFLLMFPGSDLPVRMPCRPLATDEIHT